ncbi:SIMPL domain-containing protein [Cycloclasticus pugetii]|uniref:SIMPL domain-containing protein n=1 Tax=Cycloclasticus pugetii TaxID=34068 RepID=UPI00090F2076|nr:SIMPL domain-containing protein [Cycloclasticus pugetii]SHJ38073.1 Predicted secreted protein [Cycloclasticus pugetii]|tara:strand:+ start:301 stop:990 length:690 start_codon:yes stop_codon:yes gene_type:complete
MNKWILLFNLIFLTSPLMAHDKPFDGVVNLQASASLEIETDTMLASIAVEAEHYDPAVLAEQINQKMSWALKTAAPFKTVKVKGGQYTSHQLYNKRIFKAWRGIQTITLESKDSEHLGKLIGLLQKELLIKSLRYQVSEEKLNATKQLLTKQAIADFKAQAQTITNEFDKNKYIVHQINIHSNNQHRPVYYAKSRMLSSSVTDEAAPANLQQNTSTIQVNVNGSIRLVD